MRTRTDRYSHFNRVEIAGDSHAEGNGVQITPAEASSAPAIAAVGDDTNVSLTLTAKGTGAILASSPLGYGTGAGGTVTQATSKSTTVTLSTATGTITMASAALAAATIVSFTFTNTLIAAGDVLVLNHVSGGTVGSYTLNAQCAAGAATINVRNNSAGSLSDAIRIGFALIKGATA